MKITTAFNMKMQMLARDNYSDNTYENYKYACKMACAFFKGKIEDITFDDVQDYKKFLRIKHKPTIVRGYVTCLHSVIKLCKRRGLDVMDPDDISIPKAKSPKVAYLSEDQVNKFISVADVPKRGYSTINRFRNVLIIKMLFTTELRVSELVALNRDSIQNCQFSVAGKSKDERPCYITKEIQDMIDTYLTMRNDDNEALFVSNQTGGKRLSKKTVQCMFRRVRKQAKMGNIHPHTMRHSYGTYMIEHDVDVRDLAELMGHQSLQTTKVYTHVRDNRLRDIYHAAMG